MTDEEIHERRWLILAVLCLTLLLIVVDNTIVNVALPTIQRDLDASTGELQWIVDSYVLVFAGLLLTAGALGDRFGRKGALTLGLVIMGVAATLSALATSTTQLIATRAVMGVGGAFIMPSTLSILTNVFKDHRERGRAIAIWAGTSGMAVALGPITGGWLLEHFWWGSVFLVNVVVIAVALAAGHVLVPTSKDPNPRRLDPPGALLSIAGLVTLVWAIITAGEEGWSDSRVLVAFTVAAGLLTAFLLWERRTDHPMLELGFFRNPRFTAASTAITLTFFAMFGSLFLLTQYLQFVHGYTAFEAGLRLLPMAVTTMLVAPLSARLVEHIGSKVVVATGLLLAAAGLVAMSTMGVDTPYTGIVWRLVLMALGLSLVMAPATESIMGSLPPARAGVGSAVNDTTRQVGGALGVAVFGSLLPAESGPRLAEAAAAAGFVDGMGTALLVGAAVAVVGAATVARFLPARAPEPVAGTGVTPERPAESRV